MNADQVNTLVTAIAALGGALGGAWIGGHMALRGEREQLTADRLKAEAALRSAVESAILRGALTLSGNIEVAIGLLAHARYATQAEPGVRKPLAHSDAVMLAQEAAVLADPLLPINNLGPSGIPAEHREAIKVLGAASSAVRLVMTHWSVQYLSEWAEPSDGVKRVVLDYPEAVITTHARAIISLAYDPGTLVCAGIWSRDEIEGLLNAACACPTKPGRIGEHGWEKPLKDVRDHL